MNPLLEETFGLIETFGRFLGLTFCSATCRGEMNRLKRFYRYLLIAGKGHKSITGEDIDLYLSVQNWNHDSKAQCVHALKRFYRYLQNRHIVENNPAEQMHVPFITRQSLVMVPLKSKVRRVLRKLELDRTPSGLIKRLLVELAYGSGLRRTELATLNVEDINLTDQTAHVLGKGRKERVVPLTLRCLRVLKEHLQNIPATQKPLFVLGNDQRIKSWQVGDAIKKSTGLHPHYFRHACATHMLINGCSILHIRELLGHERINTTQIYTKLDKEELRKVVNRRHPGRLRSVDPNSVIPL